MTPRTSDYTIVENHMPHGQWQAGICGYNPQPESPGGPDES